MKRGSVALLGLLGCGFDDLTRAPEPPPETDDLEGAVEVEGIQVLPAVIHPGDRVLLHDPVRPGPGQPASLYLWDACAGTFEGATLGRDATWVAPSEPGLYAVTVNVADTTRDDPSRVLPLCVAAQDEQSCAEVGADPPVLSSLSATPDSFVQATECMGACRTTLQATVAGSDGVRFVYRWAPGGGEVEGLGPEVVWLLPTVGCCTESFPAALTACGGPGTAATGFTHGVVVPE